MVPLRPIATSTSLATMIGSKFHACAGVRYVVDARTGDARRDLELYDNDGSTILAQDFGSGDDLALLAP